MTTGAPERHPSQADEALRQSRATDAGMSAANVAAHDLAGCRTRPLPAGTRPRRRALASRGW